MLLRLLPGALLLTSALLLAAPPAEPDWAKVNTESLKHFQSVVRIDSSNPPGNESKVVEYLRGVLEAEGIPCKTFELEKGRANLVARLKGSGKKKPLLILGHTDTVGVQREKWPVDPFSAVVQDGYVWGRGTTDNKDIVTAGLVLMLQLKRLNVPLDRDVIYVAEAGEEGTSRIGIQFLVNEHWSEIEAEYALAEGGFIHADNGRVRYLEVATTEKVPRGVKLVATGTSGHGSRPRLDNAVGHLTGAVHRVFQWEPPMRLNDTTRTFFERLANISPPEEAARYKGIVDPAKTASIQRYFAQNDLGKYSILRTTVSPTMVTGGFRSNVIPSSAEATLDIRAVPDEDMPKFYAELEKIINDPAVKIVTGVGSSRPAPPPSRLDTEMFRVLEATQKKLYPDAITVPGMVTGATDLAQLRAKGVQAYGIGPQFDEPEFAEHGWHSDVERLSEKSLYGLVKFVWFAVTGIAAAN